MRVSKKSVRRRRRRQANAEPPRGMALIMVLVLTTVLAAMAADTENEASVNLKLATNARDQLQAHFHARSAIELELMFLRFQGMMKQTIGKFIPIPLFELSTYFVSSDTMKGILTREDTPRDSAPEDEEEKDRPFGDFQGSFWIEEAVDENRKININKPALTACTNMVHLLMGALFEDPKFDPLFETLGDSRDPIRNRIELIANMTDWVDGNDDVDLVCTVTGDQALSSAAEDTRYNHLPYGARYKPKNAQFSSMEELRMVPGVNDVFMAVFGSQLTVWTDDTGINVNTADDLMLRALIRALSPVGILPGDEEKFIKFKSELGLTRAMPPPLNTISKPVFLQLLNAAGFKIDEARLAEMEKAGVIRFDDTSNVYKIKAIGRVGESTTTITVVWRDDRAAGEIRYWRED